jgi:predicted nucleotidyltransferase
LKRALRGSLDGEELAVVAPEDFVLMKVLSTRDKDLEDARSVLTALGQRLDHSQIRLDVDALAREIPDHDVLSRFARLG